MPGVPPTSPTNPYLNDNDYTPTAQDYLDGAAATGWSETQLNEALQPSSSAADAKRARLIFAMMLVLWRLTTPTP